MIFPKQLFGIQKSKEDLLREHGSDMVLGKTTNKLDERELLLPMTKLYLESIVESGFADIGSI